MHRYLLSNMDETQMNYLQNIRAMSPFMMHYDINGAANIRNGEKWPITPFEKNNQRYKEIRYLSRNHFLIWPVSFNYQLLIAISC